MKNINGITKIYPESFRINYYTKSPFRVIGLIDVDMTFKNEIERVTLAYFRSSGTNSGKIKGLWYPIVGIKIKNGSFSEFSIYSNFILSKTTKDGQSKKGWLAKSLFFYGFKNSDTTINGFSRGSHYESLLWIGESLRNLYENKNYTLTQTLTPQTYNNLIYSSSIYINNKRSQRENFELFIQDIFNGE